jgi:predicted phage tail protein
MVEVRLHGALARDFGKVWHFDIASPAEAIAAIECARPGFRQAILDLDRKGMVFRVRSKTVDYVEASLNALLGAVKRVDIIPIVRGASAGLRFVVGAALAVVGYSMGWTGVGMVVGNIGVSLMLGSVVEWLSPVPKKEDLKNGLQSWSFNGPTNTSDQGAPVPVIYGEVLVGSTAISAGISVDQVDASASTVSASIGGNLQQNSLTNNRGMFTHTVQLSAGSVGINEPLTYSWSFTGFTLAEARRLVNAGGATMSLELDYYGSSGFKVSESGTISLTVEGTDPQRPYDQTEPSYLSASTSAVVTVDVECFSDV